MASKRENASSGQNGSANGNSFHGTGETGGAQHVADNPRFDGEGSARELLQEPSLDRGPAIPGTVSGHNPSAGTVNPTVGDFADEFWTVYAKPLKGAGEPRGLACDPASKKYPRAWLLLTATKTPTGKIRKVPGLTLTPIKQGWNVRITDYMLSHCYQFEVEFLEEWLPTLERLLANGVDRWQEVQKGELHQKRKTADSKIDKIV